jgi:2-oxoglutarate ferredoxin oxidoreductase subunit delta
LIETIGIAIMSALTHPGKADMEFWRVPLDAAGHEVVVGKVNIIPYRCKGCGYCIEFCPNDVLEESTEFNEKGYYPPRVKEEGRCINCSFCESICPEFAIFCTVAERRPLRPEDVVSTVSLSRREKLRLRSQRAAERRGEAGS